MARRKIFRAWARHPVTRKPFRLSAPTPGLLAQLVEGVRMLRHRYRRGGLSAAQLDTEIRILRGKKSYTLAEAADAYGKRESLTPNTRRGIESLIRHHAAKLAPLQLTALDANTLKVWVDHLRGRQVAVTSIRCYWRRLRAVAVYAIARGWIAVLPWGDFRPQLKGEDRKVREACRNLDELFRLLFAARELDQAQRFRRSLEAKIIVAIALGLRQGELAGLRWNDLDEAQSAITIARQYDGAVTKTKHRPKRLDVAGEVFVVLAEHRTRLERAGLYSSSGPVFPALHRSKPGHPRPYAQGECLTTRSLRAVVVRAGLPNEKAWSSHSLRDTFATLESAGHGGDLATLAQRTRHRSIAALARYLRAVRSETPRRGFDLPPGRGPEPPKLTK